MASAADGRAIEDGIATDATPYKLPLAACIGWGTGTLAVAVLFNAVNVLLLRYLVDFVGLSATLAGTIIGLSKLYDAIIDPMVGAASDRSRSRHGRRRPFVLAGGFLLAFAGIMLFNVPGVFYGTSAALYVVVSLLVYATAYAVFSVPYMAMPVEMTADYHERSYLISFRVYATAIASLIAVFIGPIVIGRLGGGQAGHTALSLMLAVIIIAATLACFRMTRDAPCRYDGDPVRLPLLRKLVMIADNKPFLLLLLIKLTQLMALAVTQASMPFLFKSVLKLSDTMLGLYFLVFYGVMIATQQLWIKAARRYGKRDLFFWITLIYAFLYLSWYFVTPNDPLWYLFARGAVIGAASGGVLLFGQSLLPDTMEWDYRRTGLRREGMLAGLYTVVEKLAYALGSALTGIVLGFSGYIQGHGATAVAQPRSAVEAIFLLASVAPMLLLLASCVALKSYDLSEAKLSGQVPPQSA